MFDYNSMPSLFHFRNHSSVLTDLHVHTVGFCDFARYKDVNSTFIHPHHTLHFILEGEGTYKINNETFSLQKNQVFYTPPGHSISYFPSKDKPWTYVWFAFLGKKSTEYFQQFSIAQNYIASPSKYEEIRKLTFRFLKQPNPLAVREEAIRAFFFKFVEYLSYDDAIISSQQASMSFYVSIAKDFIQYNLKNPNLTIAHVAQNIHISHSYLCAIFKQHEHISVKQYLTLCRLNYAAELLKTTEKSVTQISLACGYKDPLYFSAAFKKQFFVSPTLYREEVEKSRSQEQSAISSIRQD